MKFNLVNENKLQIILSKEDLAQHNIKKDFTPYGPEAQMIFGEILEQAYDECGFEIGQNAQLMIEAFPITGESLLITVTKLGSSSKEKDGMPNPMDILGLTRAMMGGMADRDDNQTNALPKFTSKDAVYVFQNLEHVIDAVQVFGGLYEGSSSLYRYHNEYFLLLSDHSSITPAMESALKEFGSRVEVVSEFYQEHGEAVIADHALSVLMQL